MNPSDREFYPLREAGNPASGARSRRVVDMRSAPAPRNIGINEADGGARKTIAAKPRTHDYQAGYSAGRRSVDIPAWLLAGFVSGTVLVLFVVWFGSMLLAGI